MLLERTRTLLPAWAALRTTQSSSAMLAARFRLCEIRTCKISKLLIPVVGIFRNHLPLAGGGLGGEHSNCADGETSGKVEEHDESEGGAAAQEDEEAVELPGQVEPLPRAVTEKEDTTVYQNRFY